MAVITGNVWGDYLTGAGSDDQISGLEGDDSLFGGAGNDTLLGGDGNDYLNYDSAAGGYAVLVNNLSKTYALPSALPVGGGGGADTMDGGSGADVYGVDSTSDVVSDSGADVPATPSGGDVVVSSVSFTLGSGVEHLYLTGAALDGTGNALDNMIHGNDLTNHLIGGQGNDSLYGYGGNDTLDGGSGTDTAVYYFNNGVNINLATGTATGSGGNDVLISIENAVGSMGNDTIIGSSGNNWLMGKQGDDFIDGGIGNDTIGFGWEDEPLNRTIDLTVTSAQNTGSGLDTIVNIESIEIFGQGNDVVHGNSGDNRISTDQGFDRIWGGAGNDYLSGGADDDDFNGGSGNDTIDGGDGGDWIDYADFTQGITLNLSLATGQNLGQAGIDTIISVSNARGTTGADHIVGGADSNWFDGYFGNDTLDGNDAIHGNDGVGYDNASSAVTLDLAAGTARVGASETDVLIDIDNANGSVWNDSISGNDYDNYLSGGVRQLGRPYGETQIILDHTGNDTIDGRGGRDTIAGFDGNDKLVGGAGDDTLYGGIGADTFVGGAENDYIVGDEDWTVDTDPAHGWNDDWNQSSDTVDYSSVSSSISVNLETGSAYDTGIIAAIGMDTLRSIENVVGGTANDTIVGSAAANTLNGGAGADSMSGGDGGDTYYVENAGDVATETNAAAAGGVDTVYSYLSAYTLGANVENLRLAAAGAANGSGNSLNNAIYAGAGNNVMDGSAGTDTVSYAYATAGVTVSLATTTAQATGGSGSDTLLNFESLNGSNYNDTLTGNSTANTINGGNGADSMGGGDGSDIYIADNVGDVISETNAVAATGGTDTVYSYLSSYTLNANVENLRLLASSAANATGNALTNTLYAGAGNNVMDGSTGVDTASYLYAGGAVQASLATTAAQATGGSGSDTLLNIENLTGSAYGDTLTGNAVANVLDGGSGADSLVGGDGADTYYVENAGDVVSETNAAAAGGIDSVYSSLANTALGANVENLRLLSSGAANGTGNSLDNTIYAGAGNNVMDGGAGVDTACYGFATAGITASLATSAAQATGASGSDTLLNFENLRGSNYNDALSGNSNANVLNGGLGNDTLTGGAGADTFRFDTLLNAGTNKDTLTDFTVGSDHIQLENAIFTHLTATGALSADNFHLGAAADANDYIIYDAATGVLAYDADGNGAGAAVQFALVGTAVHPNLTASDFLIS